MAEHGCSPRLAWLCRQAICLPPVLLMCVGTAWMRWREDGGFRHAPDHAAYDGMVSAIGPLICYSAGQFAAMLIRSTVVAIAVGIALSVFGFMWGSLMCSWLAPTWWSVGSLPVIGLFVTWLKANDWIEERRDKVARWRLALGLGVPVCLLLATCATYRVVQIPVVTLPAEWGEDGEPKKLTAAETETLDIYRRALTELDAGNQAVTDYKTRITKSRAEHPDWTDSQRHAAAFNGFHKDWLVAHAAVVPLLKDAHSHAAIPLALLQPDLTKFSEQDWMTDKTSQFSWLMVQHARETLEAGRLDEAWQEIEVTFELIRRYRLRASPANAIGQADFHERMLQNVIADWGRHPDPSQDRVVTALRRFEQMVASQGAVLHSIHWNMLVARITLGSDERSREFIAKTAFPGIQEIEKSWTWMVWRWLPWERWRSERVVRLEARLAVQRAEGMTRLMDSNQWVPRPDWIDSTFDENLAEWIHIRTTLLPPDLTYGVPTGIGQLDQIAANRVTLLRLALADWHRQHGRYPESLSELTPTYFAVIPSDPRAAGPFVYFPKGVPDDVTLSTDNQGHVILEKGIPFLLTMGAGNAIARSRQMPDGSWEFTNDIGKPVSLSEALRSARVWRLEETPSSNE